MLPLSPILFVAAANAFVSLGEAVDAAALVHHIGFSSHLDNRAGRSSWPLPRVNAQKLGEFAEARGILMEWPMEGDVFLLSSRRSRRGKRRFTHAGIVVAVSEREDGTLECTTVEGRPEIGRIAVRRTRRFDADAGDRFIRWVELDWRVQAA
jgi:hypothetical protein